MNVPADTGALHPNDQVSVIVAVPEPDIFTIAPEISAVAAGSPPVQFTVKPAFRLTVEGRPVTVKKGPIVSEAVNGPTFLPPPPVTVYWPGMIVPSCLDNTGPDRNKLYANVELSGMFRLVIPDPEGPLNVS